MARKGYSITQDKDYGEKHIREILRVMNLTPGGPHIKVGLLKDSGMHKESTDLTVVEIAIINEFGTDTIPARPFMRLSALQLEPIMRKFTGVMLEGVAANKISLDNALERMGLLCKAHIQKVIRDWKSPPNAPSTILQKARKTNRAKILAAFRRDAAEGRAMLSAFDNPLVDTAQMVGSINYIKVKK